MSSMNYKEIVYANDSYERQDNVQEINADVSFPVIIETSLLSWEVPVSGINQKCLERVGKDKLRLTTLAQFSAGRSFKKFDPVGGVEFFVLSGVFSDATGDYKAGCYVRSPEKMFNESFTSEGCTVLFRLGQFQPLDQKRVVINSRDAVSKWKSAGEPGVSCLDLHHFAEEAVALYRIRAECWITFKSKNQSVEVFVCEGSISVDGNYYETGTWLRYPAGSKVKVLTKIGACLYVRKNIFSICDESVSRVV